MNVLSIAEGVDVKESGDTRTGAASRRSQKGIAMQHHIRTLAHRRRGDTGASAMEYGLLVALIAAVIVVAAFALGGLIRDTFTDTCDGTAADDAAAAECEPAAEEAG
jgi:pilus assembly protein Flp/PilA